MLGLSVVGFWNISLTVNDFYNHDVITNIKRVTPENVTFPAITICTNGTLRKDYYVNGVLNKSQNIILISKDFGGLLWLAQLKSYNKSTEWYDEINVKEKGV